MALRRLEGLKRSFMADPDLFLKYRQKIVDYIENGYAELIPSDADATPGRTYYIPHHYTSALTKFCVVFDCSAKFRGKALNDMLLQGSQLTNSVAGVFLKFRERPIAVIGDIKAMFSQVLVDERDRDALRFLWYPDDDISKPPFDCRMKTHVFGAKSPPSCAAFALQMTAEENAVNADPSVVETVTANICVDDLRKSCRTVDEAVNLLSQLCALLKSKGFHSTKFSSNN